MSIPRRALTLMAAGAGGLLLGFYVEYHVNSFLHHRRVERAKRVALEEVEEEDRRAEKRRAAREARAARKAAEGGEGNRQ